MINILFLISVLFVQNDSIEFHECNCSYDLDFVIDKVETEHPGFKLNVTKNNRSEYDAHVVTIKNKLEEDHFEGNECAKIINEYLSFIKDKHLVVYKPSGETAEDKTERYLSEKAPSYEIINDETVYLKIPSFNYRMWQVLDQYYIDMLPVLSDKKYVIIDIRNNGGGGERMYNGLFDLLKKSKNVEETTVLWNKRCASACEEVALKFSSMKNVTTMGENTNGCFAYGFIKDYATPTCHLKFIITTKKYKKRIPYEYVGVPPEVILPEDSDWLEAALNKIH